MLAEAALVSGTVTELLAGGRFLVRSANGAVHTAMASGEVADGGFIAMGDAVSMMPAGSGFPALIVRIDEPRAPRTPSAPFSGRTKRLSPERLKIDRAARPDWPTGAEQMPTVGEQVYCTEGLCSVTKVLGRTGNGSRLLELRLHVGDQRPFFAAASNVLVEPRSE